MRSPSTITSPRLMPMRNSMRRWSGNAAFLRHCSEDPEIDIDRASNPFYTTAPNPLSQESQPCLDQVNTCQTQRRALSMSRTFLCPNLWRTTVTTSTPPVHDGAISPLATHLTSAPCTTL